MDRHTILSSFLLKCKIYLYFKSKCINYKGIFHPCIQSTSYLGACPFWVVCVCVCVHARSLSHFSRVWLFATLWTVARQAPLPMGLSRQEYRSGLLYPPPRNLPDPGSEPASLMSPALVGRFFTTCEVPPGKPLILYSRIQSNLSKTYLFTWLFQVFLETFRISSCSMWDLVPRPGIKPRSPTLGEQSLNHWTTIEGPQILG